MVNNHGCVDYTSASLSLNIFKWLVASATKRHIAFVLSADFDWEGLDWRRRRAGVPRHGRRGGGRAEGAYLNQRTVALQTQHCQFGFPEWIRRWRDRAANPRSTGHRRSNLIGRAGVVPPS